VLAQETARKSAAASTAQGIAFFINELLPNSSAEPTMFYGIWLMGEV
jgi:hypothetical protein